MDWERRCMAMCAGALALAVGIRLAGNGWLEPMAKGADNPRVASFLVYLQTGRVVRLPTTELTLPIEPTQPEPTAPVFAREDLELVELTSTSDAQPDYSGLLTQPLGFDLRGEAPAVLILHTHTTESYTPGPGQSYTQTSEYRTLDEGCNMLAVGDRVAQVLEEAGIRVIHDRTFHDYPSYNGSYQHAAETTAAYMEQYPSIRLILDLHRDAADTAYGQMRTEATVDGQASAQIMMVVGTDGGGLTHPDWQENLSLALKLQVVLERANPGLCRDLALSWQRFNQHFAPGALLVEVGAAGNTLDEALVAATALAEGIVTLFPQ